MQSQPQALGKEVSDHRHDELRGIFAEGAISQEFGPQPWEPRVGLGLSLALSYGFLCIGSAPAGQLLAF